MFTCLGRGKQFQKRPEAISSSSLLSGWTKVSVVPRSPNSWTQRILLMSPVLLLQRRFLSDQPAVAGSCSPDMTVAGRVFLQSPATLERCPPISKTSHGKNNIFLLCYISDKGNRNRRAVPGRVQRTSRIRGWGRGYIYRLGFSTQLIGQCVLCVLIGQMCTFC